jgi:crotonobetainyl-CoA:carnitine CoA-transferase CaiB-like acyl-CoA transferase
MSSPRYPLDHIRVFDATQIWAGPHMTRLFAGLGADIIKVESIQRTDMTRGRPNPPPGFGNYPNRDPGPDPWNRSGAYNAVNVNKRSVTLNFKDPRGAELARRLAAHCDVFVENYRYGVMDRLGLGYDEIRKVRDDIIYVTMPPFGRSGPERDYAAYGINQEHISGQGSMTGYDDGIPVKSGINQCDPITGIHAAGAVLAALVARERTGRGTLIEVSHLEANVAFVAPAILDYQMNGRDPEKRGNRHPWAAPHQAYRCAGEDNWVTIAVFSDDEFRGLCSAIGTPELVDDPRFSTVGARKQHELELDPVITAWTAGRSHRETMELLQRHGVRAGAVLSSKDLMEDPHYAARGFFQPVALGDSGVFRMTGMPMQLKRTALPAMEPAPALGRDNRDVLCGLLGIPESELADLETCAIIGTRPVGAA